MEIAYKQEIKRDSLGADNADGEIKQYEVEVENKLRQQSKRKNFVIKSRQRITKQTNGIVQGIIAL